MSIKSISKYTASKLSTELSFTIEKQQIIEYGMMVLLSQLLSLVLLFFVAFMLNMIVEVLIVTVCSTLLRRYSGGAHCSSPLRCAILSAITVPLLVFLSKFIYGFSPGVYMVLVVLISFISIVIFYLYSPKDSPEKPIKNQNKIKKLKTKSTILSIFIFIVSISLFFLNFGQASVLISLGVFNQALTLTKSGYAYIDLFDIALRKILL